MVLLAHTCIYLCALQICLQNYKKNPTYASICGKILHFFLFLCYFYTFSFKNRLPSPAIGIMICSDLCIFLFTSQPHDAMLFEQCIMRCSMSNVLCVMFDVLHRIISSPLSHDGVGIITRYTNQRTKIQKKSHICKHMRENFTFFLFLSYFYFKNRFPSPAIGIMICRWHHSNHLSFT